MTDYSDIGTEISSLDPSQFTGPRAKDPVFLLRKYMAMSAYMTLRITDLPGVPDPAVRGMGVSRKQAS